jgi:diguanylate cyclase (GGDEF)-like protein
MGLTRKILLFTSLLVIALVTITLAYTTRQAEQLALASLDRALRQAQRVWTSFQADRYEKLKLGVRVFGNDPAFKAAVQTRDPATVRDLLQERGRDLAADLFVATDAAGLLIARSDGSDVTATGTDLSQEPLVARPLSTGQEAATVWAQGDALYEAVSVPMSFGDEPVGVLIAGYRIDERLASEIHAFTEGDVAFVARVTGRPPRLVASTLGPLAAPLSAVLGGPEIAGSQQGADPFEVDFAGDRFLAVQMPLGPTGGGTGTVLVLRSLSREMVPFNRFRAGLAFVSFAVMALALVVAAVGARRITGPLQVLVGLVERVRDGSYTGAVTVDSRDEIGALATAFDRMREGIAAREDQIRRMALQDPLTGLPNRALFDDRLQQALVAARRASNRLAVLVVGIDRLKAVNDTLGHHAGDEVLRQVGARLAHALRGSDTVARLGGDEFAVLLPATGAERARRLAVRLGRALHEAVEVEGKTLHVAGTVGAALSPDHGDDPVALVRHAESAMYVAKREGTALAFYDAAQDSSSADRLWLVEELREALEQRTLTLEYQPKVDLGSGRAIAVEALARWIHPTRGVVSPAQFIPAAEQAGLIRKLTRHVLEVAVTQCAAWHAAGMPVEVAINVSARDLLSSDLEDAMEALLRTTGLDPRCVCLEITESAVMEDPQHAMGVLARLRAMGMGLSIDDFGTGYSSLSYLRRLPVSEIKIDRSFVMAMQGEDDDTAIVRATIELGHNLGLTVVAEGVENEAAYSILRTLGCDLAQGYHVSRPLPADAVLEWMRVRAAVAPVA